MDKETIQELRAVVGDMRFMQAAALVASGLNENKQAQAYMSRLAKLDKKLGDELTELLKG